jgi:hypothetical protein
MPTGSPRRSVVRMKHLLTAAVTAASVLAIVAATASGHSTGTTIRLVQHDKHFAFIDNPPKGGMQKPPSEGDQYVIGGVDTENGRPAGTTNLVCVVTQPGKKAVSTCNGSLILAKGTITATGVSSIASNRDTYAITGGTGAYAGARGVLVTTQGKNESTLIVVKLI